MAIQAVGTDATAGESVKAPAESIESITVAHEIIHHGGRQFICTPEMARIFLTHAQQVIESGDEQLVPLLHSGGIELLLVSRATPYSLDVVSSS
ncbi:MAG: hypothetical protein ABI238_01260 [Terrimesophilobacter sp.]